MFCVLVNTRGLLIFESGKEITSGTHWRESAFFSVDTVGSASLSSLSIRPLVCSRALPIPKIIWFAFVEE